MTLDELMVLKKATNHNLAELSGYSVRTVCNARRGLSTLSRTMDILIETLYQKQFQRDSRGAQKSYSRHGHKGNPGIRGENRL